MLKHNMTIAQFIIQVKMYLVFLAIFLLESIFQKQGIQYYKMHTLSVHTLSVAFLVTPQVKQNQSNLSTKIIEKILGNVQNFVNKQQRMHYRHCKNPCLS